MQLVGQLLMQFNILIFARNYDTRSGGMFVLDSGGSPSAVVIKATLNGGIYPNEWIAEPTHLKYYLKSINKIFGEHFKANAVVIGNPQIPIHTFVRNTDNDHFTYEGVFNYQNIHRASDGSKWFELIKTTQPIENFVESRYISKEFDKEVIKSSKSNREIRLARLKKAAKKAQQVLVVSTAFVRNPDVVAEVLYRAKGICESCLQPAPFIKRSDSTPYLEVHHKLPLAKGGDDVVENAVALCPNCHRLFHFG